MKRVIVPFLLILLAPVLSCVQESGLAVVTAPTGTVPEQPEIQRGVSWVAGREVRERDLLHLVDNHVNWIVQTPFGWQRGADSPEVILATQGRILWGERDSGLEETTRLARKHGIKTLLKPHIWVSRSEGKWRGDIAMSSAEDWEKWFDGYRRFILHYAALAERTGIEAFCIGTELHQTAVQHPEQWRRIIREVREIYGGGELTYAANWYLEFEEIEFWDELDFIGIQAYFPLAYDDSVTLDTLKAAWLPHVGRIERAQRRFDKPVIFTEIGYRSDAEAALEPWKWPDRLRGMLKKAHPEIQADCYRAFFETFWHREWFAGVYFWKWYPHHERVGGPDNIDFTPQNKPAQLVMKHWFGSAVVGD